MLAVPVKAFVIHAGLLATGAKQGTPVRWEPAYAPPTGSEIEILLLWKDEKGNVRKARAQDWVRDVKTGKAMTQPWVFAGSKMHKDEETGKQYYLADSSGDLVCVSNFSSAMLDVPMQSSDSNAELMFEAFTEHIPPLGTPVTMVMTPKLSSQDSGTEPSNP
ncbi:MAG: YdjY domain-containing protein [Thermoguttaceae bacterium]